MAQMPERLTGAGVDLSYLAQQAQAAKAGGASGAGAGAAGTSGADRANTATGQISGQTVDIPAVAFDITDATFEAALQLSRVVPVVMVVCNEASEAQHPIFAPLRELVRQMGGTIAAGKIDASTNPQLVQGLQVQSVPHAFLLLAGRPEHLFQGSQSGEVLQQLLAQIVQLAAQQGMTGRVAAPDLQQSGDDESIPAEPPINPAHAAAIEAAEKGDYATAITEYKQILARNPRDNEASAALAQMQLLQRLQGKTAAELRQAAGDNPKDPAAQMAVADLDIAGGHIEDAFLRLLELFSAADSDARATVQERLLELFEVVGTTDPRVMTARRQLANLLY
ncbi:MAG: tetratricopeptide repeat protein [Microbacteriaceae bacterium]|nr:tetratricopeptide repeat protein [Microbacteriaceae bacterium]